MCRTTLSSRKRTCRVIIESLEMRLVGVVWVVIYTPISLLCDHGLLPKLSDLYDKKKSGVGLGTRVHRAGKIHQPIITLTLSPPVNNNFNPFFPSQ